MHFEVRGVINTTNTVLVDNNHFGKWTTSDNPNYCTAPYPHGPNEFYVTGSTCINAPDTTAKFVIHGFYNGGSENTYTVTGPNNPVFTSISQAADTAVLIVKAGQYVIKATDAFGCVYRDTIVAGNPKAVMIANPLCVPVGDSAKLTVIAYAGNGPYQFSFAGSNYAYSTYGGAVHNDTTAYYHLPIINNAPTPYSIFIKDSMGCESKVTKYIGTEFPVTLGVNPQWCPGVVNFVSTLTATAPSAYNFPVSYSFSGPPPINPAAPPLPNTRTIYNLGWYYVVVTDTLVGCTATDSVKAVHKPAPEIYFEGESLGAPSLPITVCLGDPFQMSVFTNASNPIYSWAPSANLNNATLPDPSGTVLVTTTFTVTVTDGITGCSATATKTVLVVPAAIPITYTLSEPCIKNSTTGVTLTITSPVGVGYLYQYSAPFTPQIYYQPSPILNIYQNNLNYTITAQAPSGCKSSIEIYLSKCCERIGLTENAIWIPANETALSYLGLNAFPLGTTPVVFQGNFNVNNNMDIMDHPNVYFATNALLSLSQGSTLTVDNSTLKSCGVKMWNGIKADQSNETIKIRNNSMIKEAFYGVQIENDALLEATDSKFFKNGNTAISIRNMTLSNYAGIILRNLFYCDGTALLPPGVGNKTGSGIRVQNVRYLSIGMNALGQSYGTPNTFRRLNNGISMLITNPTMTNSNVDVRDAHFDLIQYYNTPYNKIQTKYLTYYGSAIWANNAVSSCNAQLSVYGGFYGDSNKFIDCDKGIVTNNTITYLGSLKMENVLMGCMMRGTAKWYIVSGNKFKNVFHSIELLGTGNRFIITKNTINTASAPITLIPAKAIWPVGINVTQYSNALVFPTYYYNRIDQDTITIPCIGGTGIMGNSWNDAVRSHDNIISFTTLNVTSATNYDNVPPPFTRPELYGYLIKNGQNSSIKHNLINGINVVTKNQCFNARRSNGLFVENSINFKYDCNQLNNTWYGLRALGNCATTFDYCRGNLFNNHKEGISLDVSGAVQGTLGDIGSSSYWNANYWNGTYATLFNNVSGVNEYVKIRKNNSLPGANKQVFSNPNVNNFQSFPDQLSLLSRYEITPLAGNVPGYKDQCMLAIPYNPDSIKPLALTSMMEAMHIATASSTSQSTSNAPIEAYYESLRLFGALETDVSLRNSNANFIDFYDEHLGSDIERLNDVNKLFALLSDSVLVDSPHLIQPIVQEISDANDGITSSFDFVLHEKAMNAIYVKYLNFGLDSISVEDSLYVDSLAMQCPSIAGYAVYKARMLYSFYNSPIAWDDQYICANSGGLNKASNNWLDDYRNQQALETIDVMQPSINLADEMTLYPNPSQGIMEIKYHVKEQQDVKINIYDLVGKLCKRVDLNPLANYTQFSLYELQSGVYTYDVMIDDSKAKSGKLTLLK
jgi:hypothetical protein